VGTPLFYPNPRRKHHIVCVQKYRRKIFYGEHKAEIGKILRQPCDWKGIKIEEEKIYHTTFICWRDTPKETFQDSWDFGRKKQHIHIRAPWKSKNINMGNEASGAGDIIKHRGEEHEKIAEYIQSQLKKGELHDQLTCKEYTNPFTGSRQRFLRRYQAA